ncbi:predicted protein [Uncinocarpus reesii 1704]|uniref:DUF6536 domain-containing protein n=1 Tax=Uncinocarpus reesii (strain UAMH 1704) TaxID=336963 RepID=C4JQL6_UNCRE|nr:uncharacterized protein UREG_03361 [Uncinocarpus reesii 1704]EEP78515.1 predicted protein [Uncinocarpus reesii 1704]
MKRALWHWHQKGWRRTAVINTICIFIFTVLTISLLAWSSSRSGSVNASLILYRGNCATSKNINLWLHLVLNVFSTGVLASSNFFMQVLSSPSRSEVNAAHKDDTPLEIGVPSLRNLFYISYYKKVLWALFLISSVPIHLFFNSVIFATDYQGGHWHLTIASEDFVNEAQYFQPGAMLLPAGVSEGVEGFGQLVPVTDYFNPESNASQYISSTARSAQTWKRIDVPECRSQYEFCSARTTYGDVVMVVESHDPIFMFSQNNRLGWTRDGIFGPLDPDSEDLWGPHIPASESNSLWFAANCSTTADLNPRTHRIEGCFQTCNRAYGQQDAGAEPLSADNIQSNRTFRFLVSQSAKIPEVRYNEVLDLKLKYCLVQKVEPVCKVGLSNSILLTVIICVMIKTCLCIFMLAKPLSQEPLVVLGDAIASFIITPDERTAARCTLNHSSTTSIWAARPINAPQPQPQPQRWHHRNCRWFAAVSKSAWIRSYIIFAGVIAFVGAMLGSAQSSNPLQRKQTLSHSPTNGLFNANGYRGAGLRMAALQANAPQLLLSFSYFVYNSLYTRICIEKEWNKYSRGYHPLRVTRPQGQQISTYRLQLPYRYSIPLIVISVLLHWLVSNTLYVFVLEGGK